MGFSYINGGNPNVWKLFAAPPLYSAMILEPETYDPTPEKNVDYAGLLTGLEKYFGDKQWDIQNIKIPKWYYTKRHHSTIINPTLKSANMPQTIRIKKLYESVPI